MSDMREDVRKQERLKETVKLAQERSDLEDASLVLRDSPSLYALIGNLQGKRDILPTEDASSVRSSMQTATTTSPLALPLAQIAASSVVSNKAYIYLDGTMSVEALHTSYTSDHVIESPDCLISLSDHLSSTSDNVGNSTTDLSAPLSDLVPPGMPTTTLIDKQKRTLTTDDSVLTLVVECQETAASAVMMSSSTAVAKKQPTVVPPPIPPRRSKPLPPLPQLASPTVFRSPAVALDASTASKSSVSVATFDVVAIQTPCVGDNTMTRRNNDGAFSKGSVLIISETEPLSLSVSQSPSYAVTSSISSRPSFSEESKLRSQQTHVLSKRMLLHTAAAGGHIERIKGLLVAGYDINASCDDGMKAISWACRRGHWDACRLLVESKATANFKDSSGSSALHYVCRYRRLVAIGEGEGEEEEDRKNTNVVSKNTTANKTEEAKRTRTPKRNGDAKDGVSQRAAYDATLEHRRMVKLLVDAGARVNGADENGRTALHYATENDYTGVVDALLIQKAALNLPDRHNSTALHLACAVKRERTDEIVLLLLREMEHALPSAIDMQDKGGHTPFQYAFTNSLDVVAVELVRRGADPRVPAFLTCGDTKRQQALLEIAAASIENMLHLKRGVRPHPLPIKLPPSCSSQRAPNSSRPPCASKKKFGYFTTRSNCKSCGYVYCPECVVKIDTTLVVCGTCAYLLTTKPGMSQLLLSSPVPKTSTPRQFNAQNLRVPSSMDTTDRKRAIEDGYAFDGMSEVALTDDTEDNDRREDNNSSGPLFCTSSAFVWLPSFSAPLCPPNPIARSFDARRSDPPSGTTRHRSFDGDKPNSGVDPQYHGAALSSPSSLPPSPHLPYYTDTTSMSPPHSSPPSPLSSLTRESSFPIPSTFSSHDTRPHVISTIARSPSGQTSAETLRNLFADEPEVLASLRWCHEQNSKPVDDGPP